MNLKIKSTERSNNFVSIPESKKTHIKTNEPNTLNTTCIRLTSVSLPSPLYLGWNHLYSKEENCIEISKEFCRWNNLKEDDYVQIEIIDFVPTISKFSLKCKKKEDYEVS
jgi:hypothetical protein